MLRENQYILRQVNIGLDLVLTAAAVGLGHLVRVGVSMYLLPDVVRPSPLLNYAWLAAVGPLVMVAALAYNGQYQSMRVRTRIRHHARRIAVACVEAALVLVAIDFAVGDMMRPAGVPNTSRAMMVLFPAVTWVLLVSKTVALRQILIAIRRRGYNYRTAVMVGSGPPLVDFVKRIDTNPIWGLKIEGIITDRPELQRHQFAPEAVPERTLGYPVMADLSRAPEVLWRTPVDEVILTPNAAALGDLRPLMEICEEMGVRTHLPLNFFQAEIARPVIDHFEDVPVLSYWATREIGPALLFKYAFDRIAAALLLVVLSPLLLMAGLAIRLSSRRSEPVLFKQTRCGLNGRLFTLYKFRTMSVDAEQRRAELEALNEQAGPVFKMERDPRVTWVGRWLRKFSIDELPQLWNVVRGEMSLVGPRPPLPEEVVQYDRWQRRRLSMKPGITCLWQVYGRNRLSFETWMKLDLEYIDNWSLMLDFKILARTVYVVLTGYGAM